MDVFKDFHKYNNPDHPNNNECLRLRAAELETRTLKRLERRNDWLGFGAGILTLFMTGTPLEMVWQFGLGQKISNQTLAFCCAGAALGIFFLTSPWRHRGRVQKRNDTIAVIEKKLIELDCPCSSEKLDGSGGR
ncbi:hypothetical protein [Paraburkholderia bryophila]|uniref:Transmembrane protein n=1 Tax=Paraburkholderia bryophila TaxID=420952 RepID=A0A7Z0AX11_9BURK|nr:hypothetical protein [Paraburkholderia bryophila]NYH12979.1 hypothetical protein [Paraburkholderia bryophila]